MEPYPDAELAELAHEIDEFGAHRAIGEQAFGIGKIASIGAGVLGNDEDFLHARCDELFRLAQNLRRGPRDEIAAQLRNDAEGTAIAAAFRDLQIGVMPRRELHALRRHEIEERLMRRRDGLMHGAP